VSNTWHFIESYEGADAKWLWRSVRADGTIETQSPPFNTYGTAVIDAIGKGFQPRREIWIVTTQHTITHYRPGRPPMTVPFTDDSPSTFVIPRQKHAVT
jgi:hypothetical protein